jgi:hypothetical protein
MIKDLDGDPWPANEHIHPEGQVGVFLAQELQVIQPPLLQPLSHGAEQVGIAKTHSHGLGVCETASLK